MKECDTLLMVGSSFPYSEFLPEEGQARGVQIDIDGRMLGLRYPMEVNLVGDARETLRALLPLLERKTDRGWREQHRGERRRLVEDARGAGAWTPANPINPQRVFWELSPRLPDGAHPHRRLRLGRQLVRARPQDPARDDGLALGQPGHDGPRRALRDRGQVRATRTGR